MIPPKKRYKRYIPLVERNLMYRMRRVYRMAKTTRYTKPRIGTAMYRMYQMYHLIRGGGKRSPPLGPPIPCATTGGEGRREPKGSED